MDTDQMEHDEFLRIVAMNEKEAQKFSGRSDKPEYLGQANPDKYRFGARVYGFRVRLPGCKCGTCAKDKV